MFCRKYWVHIAAGAGVEHIPTFCSISYLAQQQPLPPGGTPNTKRAPRPPSEHNFWPDLEMERWPVLTQIMILRLSSVLSPAGLSENRAVASNLSQVAAAQPASPLFIFERIWCHRSGKPIIYTTHQDSGSISQKSWQILTNTNNSNIDQYYGMLTWRWARCNCLFSVRAHHIQ